MSAVQPATAPRVRTASEIEAEIQATRLRLVATLQQIKPAVRRAPTRFVEIQVGRVRGVFLDEYGGLRPERVAGAVVIVVSIVVIRKARRRKAK